MDGDAVFPIGEPARRTGLTVKAIRFCSDEGIVPPTGRSPAGYRFCGHDAVARLDLLRTLREPGLDLPTIRRVLDRELAPAEVAAAHAEALAAQIGVLRLRRAVLTAVAERGAGPEEMGLMHGLAKLSEDGRRRLVGDFLDHAFGDLADARRSRGSSAPSRRNCPDGRRSRRSRPGWNWRGSRGTRTSGWACGGWPSTTSWCAKVCGPIRRRWSATPPRRRWPPGSSRRRLGRVGSSRKVLARVPHVPVERLAALLEAANDPRRERCPRLSAVVNGWPPPESATPAFGWFLRALGRGPVDAGLCGSVPLG